MRKGESGTPQPREAEGQSDTRRMAMNFLQPMGDPGGEQEGEIHMDGYGRRSGKEPAPSPSQAEEGVTPPEHMTQQDTPPTRPYGGAGPSRFRPTPPGLDKRTTTTINEERQRQGPMANTPWGLRSAARHAKKDTHVIKNVISEKLLLL